ncbi:MAG: hypothetical protein Fur0046_40500 [Cyanobacteria bacterium J069]
MNKLLSAAAGLLLGVLLLPEASVLAQGRSRDFTLRAVTVASFCPGRLENPTDLVINEVNGGIGSYLTADRLPGMTVQAFSLAQMGGEAAVRSRFRQMLREAEGDRYKSASQNTVGRGGVTLIQYDREGAETSRSVSFIQGDLFIAVTGITTTEVAACSPGGVISLAQHISEGLLFADAAPPAEPATPPTQDPARLLAGAQRVSGDRCLVDVWSLEALPISDTLARQGALLLSSEEVGVELEAPQMTGTHLMTIEPDGSVWMEWSSFTIQVKGTVLGSDDDSATLTLEHTLNGAAAGTMSLYRRGGEALLWAVVDQSGVTQESVMSYEAQVQGRRLRDRQPTYSGPPQPSLSDGVASYRCEGDTLSITLKPLTEDGGEPPLTWRYTRRE